MKTSTSILNIFLASLTLFACQEFEEGISDIPVLTLNPIDEETITDISANLLCEVAYDTEASIWAENMSFRISENETLSDEESLFVPVERFDETETEQEGVKKMSALGVATNLKPSTTYYYALYATDGHLLQKSDIQSFTTKEATGETPWQAIDLGLSVKWASCNVGARTPYQKGGYYAWGETNVKLTYTQDNYNKTEKGSNICDTEFDVAHVLWGDGWRMPTSEEVSELYNKCKWEYDGFNKGVRVKGPNGKSIFLPAGGSSLYSLGIPKKDETTTRYWSGSGTNVNAVTLHAQGNLTQSTSCPHYMGLLVRPVYDESLLPKNNFEFSNVTHTLWENGETGSFITEKNMGTFFFYDEKFRDNNIETYCTPDAPKWIPNADIPLNAEWMMAYAYWPYTQTYEMRDNQPYIPVDNNGQDYLYGACEYISNENTPTNMHMNSAMSEISFAITSEETVTVCEIIVKDNEHSLYKTGWMNVSTGNIGGTEAAQTVTFATKFEVGRDLTVYVNKHLFPMSFSENQIQVGCKIAETGDTIYNYLPADIWEQGQSYNYPITLTKKEEGSVPVGEAIDLGLSVKWASFNVGATKPEEYGGYYAWGETEEKENYSWETYNWCNGTAKSMTKYCIDSSYGTIDKKTKLEPEDDVAQVKWGGDWRMPTQAEYQELLEKCTWTWTKQNGVAGYVVSGNNGNSIFLPAAGYRLDTNINYCGTGGYFWTNALCDYLNRGAYYLVFSKNLKHCNDGSSRYFGHPVRPVCDSSSDDTTEAMKTFTVNGVTFNMIGVKKGTFNMGSSDEQPVHSVTLTKSYYVGETEVTQELYKAVMGTNPSAYSGDQRPVEYVSWNDCQTFITKLNELTGQTFRLPTEAEWEFAARGGNESKGYTYSGSNTVGDVACYLGNYSSGHNVVKSKSPNELGIYDMSGNVWEWCQDWYGSYSSGSQTDPTGPTSGSNRVLRGGSWGYAAACCRVAYRVGFTPTHVFYHNGFRLAL